MFQHPRKSMTLQILETLQKRTQLSADAQATYERLYRGYIGEVIFANMLEKKLQRPCMKLFDLQLKIGGNECQIDNLTIFQNEMYLFEIKNFEGDYYTENNRWYTVSSKKEIRNPLNQLSRADLLLREFLTNKYPHVQIRSYVVFVNPAFQLYGSNLQMPIIFPTQLNRFIEKLRNLPCALNANHTKLAETLTNAHVMVSAHEQIPEYDYANLRKGITCAQCDGWMVRVGNNKKLMCNKCKVLESTDSCINRSVNEFSLLFSEQNITVSHIFSWTNEVVSKKSIRTSLLKNFELVNLGSQTYYIIR